MAQFSSAMVVSAHSVHQSPGTVLTMCAAAEHCLRYDNVAKRLNSAGFFVFAHDHGVYYRHRLHLHHTVGHGQSTGIRMHISDFQIYVRDVIADISATRAQLPPGLPMFIVGISMGGTIAAHVRAVVLLLL